MTDAEGQNYITFSGDNVDQKQLFIRETKKCSSKLDRMLKKVEKIYQNPLSIDEWKEKNYY